MSIQKTPHQDSFDLTLPGPPYRSNGIGSADLSPSGLLAYAAGSTVTILDSLSFQLVSSLLPLLPLPPFFHMRYQDESPSFAPPSLDSCPTQTSAMATTTNQSLPRKIPQSLVQIIFQSFSPNPIRNLHNPKPPSRAPPTSQIHLTKPNPYHLVHFDFVIKASVPLLHRQRHYHHHRRYFPIPPQVVGC